MEINGDKPLSVRLLTPNVVTEITDRTVIATLREVVAERPDHVYRRPEHMPPVYESDGSEAASCLYVHTSPTDESDLMPGCLVGEVLHRLGVPLEELATREGRGAYEVARDFNVSAPLASALSFAQGRQDGGSKWSVALATAQAMEPKVFDAC